MEKIVLHPECAPLSHTTNTVQTRRMQSGKAILPSACDDSNENQEENDDEVLDRLLKEFIADMDAMEEPSEDTDNDDDAQPTDDHCDYPEEERVPAEVRLKNMIGLAKVKSDMEEAKTMALFVKQRKELGLDTTPDNRHHMLFLGNPGTGKTTVAKLVGEMYHEMGLLSVGHTIETSRANLVGEFIGQTEKITNEAIDRARGGVLFIDEAYTLINSTRENNDFGKEVINALLAVLSEPNPNLIIILAGYEDKMQQLLSTNPGLQERFPLKFHFEDYNKEELQKIAHCVCDELNFKFSPAADKRLAELIEQAIRNKDEYFGNGRWVHNLIEHGIIKSMAKRVMATPTDGNDRELFCLIEESDVIDAEKKFLQNRPIKIMPHIRIGFTA